MSRLHHAHRDVLDPFAAFYNAARDPGLPGIRPRLSVKAEQAFWFYDRMMGGEGAKALRLRIARAASKLTRTNCWYATWEVIRDPPFLEALNRDGVLLHWANAECHVPGKAACKPFRCEAEPPLPKNPCPGHGYDLDIAPCYACFPKTGQPSAAGAGGDAK